MSELEALRKVHRAIHAERRRIIAENQGGHLTSLRSIVVGNQLYGLDLAIKVLNKAIREEKNRE